MKLLSAPPVPPPLLLLLLLEQECVVLKLREWMENGVPEYGLLSFGQIQELQAETRCVCHSSQAPNLCAGHYLVLQTRCDQNNARDVSCFCRTAS